MEKDWIVVAILILLILIPFIYFMVAFFVYYPGNPSTIIEKTLFETDDIYIDVSNKYEYRIMLDSFGDESPKQLAVTVTQNSDILKSYVTKVDYTMIESSYWEKYEPKFAAFIPKQSGKTKIAISILEEGKSNRYFVKVYEGGSTKSYREVCDYLFLYLFFVGTFAILALVGSLSAVSDSSKSDIILILGLIPFIILIFTYYVIGGGCEICA